MDEREKPINAGPERFDAARWQLERIGWAVENRLIWPFQDRLSKLHPQLSKLRPQLDALQERMPPIEGPARVAAISATGVIAVCAVALGIGLGSSGGPAGGAGAELVAKPTPLVAAAPTESTKEESATLEGAAPVLGPAEGRSAPKQPAAPKEPAPSTTEPGAEPTTSTSSAATDTISSSPDTATTSAAATGANELAGRPAGNKALAVAREFAGAFVVYETGGTDADVRSAFASSATKELTQSLLRRPPRLPATVDVPKAKVLNVVAAPSHDGIYPVSVSLLRVGVTSELRLEMELLKGERWRVTNVLG